MKRRESIGYRIFTVFNYILLTLLLCAIPGVNIIALICFLPLINLLAVSFSSKAPVEAGMVGLWPKGFTIDSYGYVFSTSQFYKALWVSVERTVLGTAISLVLTVLLAYPLSRSSAIFRGRGVFMGLVVFAMLFGGGLVPTYIIVANALNLKNTIWALVLPPACRSSTPSS